MSCRKKSTPGFKKSEDCLTILFAKPRCFKKRVIGQSSFEDESSGDGEDESQDQRVVSNSKAVEYFEKCSLWMGRHSNVKAIQIVQLRRMMELRCSMFDVLFYDKLTYFNNLG